MYKKSDNSIVNIQKMIDFSKRLDLKVFITEQNPIKLGGTVKSLVKQKHEGIYRKMSFSCIDCRDLIKELKAKKIKNILICGIESHICILQSSIDLLRIGFNIHIISDAIKSRKSYDHNIAISRLMEAGIIITTTETVIFELCRSAEHKNFKSISKIIKQ